MQRFILTGAPGAGKTTMIDRLAAQGYATVAEAATDIIADEQARGVDAPWLRPGFVEKIAWLQEQRIDAATTDIQFHDRSPICTYALALHLGVAIPANLEKLMERIARERLFAPVIFLVESLDSIERTAARRIDLEEARAFGALHADSYRALGYRIVSVPAASAEARVAHVRAHAVA